MTMILPRACILPVIYRRTHCQTAARRPGESWGPSGRHRDSGGMDSGLRRNDDLGAAGIAGRRGALRLVTLEPE